MMQKKILLHEVSFAGMYAKLFAARLRDARGASPDDV